MSDAPPATRSARAATVKRMGPGSSLKSPPKGTSTPWANRVKPWIRGVRASSMPPRTGRKASPREMVAACTLD